MKKFFKVANTSATYSAGILVLRIFFGIYMMHHGWRKINDPLGWMGDDSATPALLQALAAISEYVGGLAMIIGLLTPLASFGILCTMAVAVVRHMEKDAPFYGKGSYELPLIFFTIAFLLMIAGPGRFSVDRLLFGKK